MAAKLPRPASSYFQQPVHHDRSSLFLPTNRKLRNLTSVSLRNLSLTPSSPRRIRGKTIDDDGLPGSLVSPAKLVALREQRGLEHSRSSQDLKAVRENEDAVQVEAEGVVGKHGEQGSGVPSDQVHQGIGGPQDKGTVNGSPKTPSQQRPPLSKMRRRSTLEWANATPQRRQEKLENVTAERMADIFFSVHVDGVHEPVYISETVERTMNPTFRHIDWSACGPGVTRLDHLTLRFWVKSAKVPSWRQLLEIQLSLISLQHLGKSLEQYHHALPQNAIIFHSMDGVYTVYPSLISYVPPPIAPSTRKITGTRLLSTSSFDALLRLSKLDDSIQDALATRNKLASDLEDLLQTNHSALTNRDKVPEAEDRLKTIDYASKTVQKQLDKARKQQDEKRELLRSRRDLMAADLEYRKLRAEEMSAHRPELQHCRDDLVTRRRAITAQRRRICEDLQRIYPISPLPAAKKSLEFTIRGLPLPDDDWETRDPPPPPLETIDKDTLAAAALGNVAHMLLLLAFYLHQPLPYPPDPQGSTSTIADPISLLKTSTTATPTHTDDPTAEKRLRTYPLFSKGVPRFRYEYGLFLLNKDIQILLEAAYGVRVVDVRQMLPNLKYLLYIATAGEGELPARKAGGVRGLLRGVVMAPGVQREGSEESVGSAVSALLFGEGKGEGKARDAVESLRRTMGEVEGKGKGKGKKG
ncbi:hypothetical protein B0A54_12698 [Friedmanniomyces endolithicus]|uniref:Autophagy-related protein 14 n=1 Tax=Friedmanniomyces endolithicus TaxID=329885 RepID=A0A4U0UPA7_9PEZI|nr:hypothetical protein LTS09_001636 [Friedmanniomyces endolithicus]KAK0308319.1 hypothetical protein LTR01_004946 [Friedmanniomyces endolithicus]KAK0827820.1 hypothetical protein LTR73_005422 [Friedmanniomyces endolithicus]TKA36856.1 hypothetical protein B0A54_12698 [Friedmanniomyces endolithicus]